MTAIEAAGIIGVVIGFISGWWLCLYVVSPRDDGPIIGVMKRSKL